MIDVPTCPQCGSVLVCCCCPPGILSVQRALLAEAHNALVAKCCQDRTCALCKRSLRPHPCHQQGGGEWCSKDAGHSGVDGRHWSLMSGYTWTSEENDKPGSTCWGDGICHAGRAPFGSFEGCPLPLNHAGPHALPPPGHAEDCLVERLRRATVSS